MTDLFIHADDRQLMARWEYAAAVFDIVARDYAAVLRGDRPHARHRTILQQTVSDLIDLRTDLERLGRTPDPAARFGELWAAAAAWVADLRLWRVPSDGLSAGDVERRLEARRVLEERFNQLVVGGATADAADAVVIGGRPAGCP